MVFVLFRVLHPELLLHPELHVLVLIGPMAKGRTRNAREDKKDRQAAGLQVASVGVRVLAIRNLLAPADVSRMLRVCMCMCMCARARARASVCVCV